MKLLITLSNVVIGTDVKNIIINGIVLTKPQKKKLFKALAKQLGYEIN